MPTWYSNEAERHLLYVAELGKVFTSRGYIRMAPPILEQADLFLRKSGGEMNARLYTFREPGGMAACLRPEITASVIRCAMGLIDQTGFPMRIQYAGPVFRYSPPNTQYSELYREYTQVGVELLGSSDAAADAEVLAMALDGLQTLGVKNLRIRLGHFGIIRNLLEQFALPERVNLFILEAFRTSRMRPGNINDLLNSAKTYGMIGGTVYKASNDELHKEDSNWLLDAMALPLKTNTGARTREEIVERLTGKHFDSITGQELTRALEFFAAFSAINALPVAAIKAVQELTDKFNLDGKCSELLQEILEAAREEGVPLTCIDIDFGLTRGFSYYTGMVFDLVTDSLPNMELGGGGRYDELPASFGFEKTVPALGFAYSLESIAMTLEPLKQSPITVPSILVPDGPQTMANAVQQAKELRAQGSSAVLMFRDTRNIATVAKFYGNKKPTKVSGG